jgi:hypothetical protein
VNGTENSGSGWSGENLREMNKQKYDDVAKVLFYIGLSLELLYVIWDKSVWQITSEGILFRVSFVFIMLKVLMSRYTIKEKAVIIAAAVFGFISYRCSSRNDVLRIVMLCAACRDMDLMKMLKYTFAVTTAGCSVLVILALTGTAGEISLTEPFHRGMVQTRYVLGLGHPNALHCMFWAMVTLALLIWYDRLRWYHYLILAAANTGLYMLTDSRTGMISVFFALLLAAFLTNGPYLRGRINFAGWAGVIGIIIMVTFSLLVAYYGKIYDDNGLWNEPHFWQVRRIDNYFTGRLWNSYGFPDSNMKCFSLFSSPECTRYMDLGYYKLFYWYGYIPGALYVAAQIAMIRYSMKNKKSALMMFVISWALYNFMEAHEISDYIGRNYQYLIFGTLWCGMLPKNDGGTARYWGSGLCNAVKGRVHK